MMKFVKIYGDLGGIVEELSDEEAGRLFKAVLAYAQTRQAPRLPGAERLVLKMLLAQFERDREAYDVKVEASRENGRKGGRPRKAVGFTEAATEPSRLSGFPGEPMPPQDQDQEQDQEQEHEKDKDNEQGQEGGLARDARPGSASGGCPTPTGTGGFSPPGDGGDGVGVGTGDVGAAGASSVGLGASGAVPAGASGTRFGTGGAGASGASGARRGAAFVPPSPEEVRQYCLDAGYQADAQRFCDFYASKGWRVGNQPMRDWQAALRNWVARDRQGGASAVKVLPEQDYDQRTYVDTYNALHEMMARHANDEEGLI